MSIVPISTLSIGDIVKVPSLSNMNQLTILNINACGTRVKGSETTNREQDNAKTIVFDHHISRQTPVEKIGVDEEIRNKWLDKEKNEDKIGGVNGSGLISENKENSNKANINTDNNTQLSNSESNNTQQNNKESNNMEQNNVESNNTPEVVSTSTAVNNTVKAIAQAVATTNKLASKTVNYVHPTGQFSTRMFAEQNNNLDYAIALAYLKLNAKVVGKQSAGRGRPTILYSFE